MEKVDCYICLLRPGEPSHTAIGTCVVGVDAITCTVTTDAGQAMAFTLPLGLILHEEPQEPPSILKSGFGQEPHQLNERSTFAVDHLDMTGSG